LPNQRRCKLAGQALQCSFHHPEPLDLLSNFALQCAEGYQKVRQDRAWRAELTSVTPTGSLPANRPAVSASGHSGMLRDFRGAKPVTRASRHATLQWRSTRCRPDPQPSSAAIQILQLFAQLPALVPVATEQDGRRRRRATMNTPNPSMASIAAPTVHPKLAIPIPDSPKLASTVPSTGRLTQQAVQAAAIAPAPPAALSAVPVILFLFSIQLLLPLTHQCVLESRLGPQVA
jgi:hypothetical protein